ncbi:MAG: histidine phosphatase family protein [Ilumatobacter sp.]|nr:histidine phosphatase family protein [Ilumatobacter sp.]
MSERTIRLVRHGRAVAGWGDSVDPDLDAGGRHQATELARRLAATPVSEIVSSPLRRCRATAQPLAALTGLDVEVDPALAEIPHPPDVDLGGRADWLRSVMEGEWTDLDDRLVAYRAGVVAAVRSLSDGAVAFSHFVAINAVIGACLGDDRLLLRRLDHASVTTVTVADTGMWLVLGGAEGHTDVR